MSTSIKIDFDSDGKALSLRVTRNGVQTVLAGGTADLSRLDALLAPDVGVVEVAATVEEALAANQVTLVEAGRLQRAEALLGAKLAARRAEVAALESREAELRDALAITDKRAVYDALARDVAEVVAIVDKTAALASLDAQIATKTEALGGAGEVTPP